jgi:L-fuculose-phosphate aldolase
MFNNSIRNEIVRYSRLMYEQGYSIASEGNISYRTGNDSILITPTNMIKKFIRKSDLVRIDLSGKPVHGRLKPTSERFTHVEIYRQRPDIKAIVHAHPFYTVLGTVIREKPLEKIFLSEAGMFLQNACFAPYAKPSTEDGAGVVRSICKNTDIIVIDRHGSFTCGPDLKTAFSRLEMLEKYCRMDYFAKLSGKEINYLTEKELNELKEIKY